MEQSPSKQNSSKLFLEIAVKFYERNDISKYSLSNWKLFDSAEDFLEKFSGLGLRYPAKHYVPLLYRLDSDDVICTLNAEEFSNDQKLICVHDYAAPGWEECGEWTSYTAWLSDAGEI